VSDHIGSNELILDMKGTEKGAVKEVKVGNIQVGLQLFSVNRYQDNNNT
jgi:hypothetical protein